MPKGRGPRTVRNPMYNIGGGGGGGGIGSIIGALYGAPTIEGADASLVNDGSNALALEQGGEEGASGLPDYPHDYNTPAFSNKVPMPTIKQPGFFQNLLTRGQAGQQAAALQNQLQLGAYDSALRQAYLQQQLTGQRENALATLGVKNDYDAEREVARHNFAASEAEQKRNQEKEKAAIDAGYPSWAAYENTLRSPDVAGAAYQNTLAGFNKQGLLNQETAAKTTDTLAQARARAWQKVGEGIFNTDNRELVGYQKPEDIVNPSEWGYSNVTLPPPVGGFVRKPGGINAENPTVSKTPIAQPVTSGQSSIAAAVQSLAQPVVNALPPVPKFDTSSMPFIPKVDLGSVTEPVKNFLGSMMFGGNRPAPAPQPQPQPDQATPPSLQPIIQPPSFLEELRRRQRLLFPQPQLGYPPQ